METEDIQQKFLNKLFLNLIPMADRKYTEKYISYFSRLVNTRLNVTTNNETNIINMIIDRTTKLGHSIEKVEKIQSLYSNLLNKKTLKRRWACLYLLSRISSDNLENYMSDSSRILQSIFQEENVGMNGYLLNNHNEAQEQNFNLQNIQNLQNSNIMQKHSPIVVNPAKSNKIITEKELINDLIFVFQGIDGHYINYNSIANAYTLNPLIPFNDNVYDIVSVLSELGWLYRKVNSHLNFFNESNIPSQFVQSFSFSIGSELSEYYKLISLFKKMNSKIEEISEGAGNLGVNSCQSEELSLKKLILWTLEPMERMKWLAIACESIYSKNLN
jgi:gamma-tubulin complex component 3